MNNIEMVKEKTKNNAPISTKTISIFEGILSDVHEKNDEITIKI